MSEEVRGTGRITALAMTVAIVTAILVSLASVVLYQGITGARDHRTQQQAINRETQIVLRRQTAALQSILCLAEGIVLQNKALTRDQLQQALSFYTKALTLIHARPCSISNN